MMMLRSMFGASIRESNVLAADMLVKPKAAVSPSTRLYTCLYMLRASASMFAARTDIAGSMKRVEKSSIVRVRSSDVKYISTPLTVETVRSTEVSFCSCAAMLIPSRTVYSFGRRIFRVGPNLPRTVAPPFL